MKTVLVAAFNRLSEAEPVKKKLEEAGIMAEIHEETGVGRFMFAAKPYAAVRIEVPKQNFQEARHSLHTWDTPHGVMRNALHCPECGSSRIEFPQFTRKFFLPNTIGLLAALGVVQKKFYCMDCQNMWLPPGAKLPAPREHEAPNYFLEDVEETKHGKKARH